MGVADAELALLPLVDELVLGLVPVGCVKTVNWNWLVMLMLLLLLGVVMGDAGAVSIGGGGISSLLGGGKGEDSGGIILVREVLKWVEPLNGAARESLYRS